MWLELSRRISIIMLMVAFATSLAVPAIPAEAHHSQMVATVSMSMDDHGACAHDGCPIDQQADTHGTCFASGTAASVLAPTTAIFYFALAQDVLVPSLDRAMVDRTIPPDPHPPKQI